ncbi:MAG: ArsB/NhaD family transporter [Anaerolineae bacterium]|nr:ArsB/NhaD family transporter [Anaerolineae bacterium]
MLDLIRSLRRAVRRAGPLSRHFNIIILVSVLFLWLCARLPAVPAAGQDGEGVAPSIAGRVLDSQGGPVGDAEVFVYVDGQDEPIAESISHFEDGTFLAELPGHLSRATLHLEIKRPHFEDKTLSLSVEDQADLRDGNTIRLLDIVLTRRVTLGFWVATLSFVGVLLLMAFERLHNTTATLLGASVILAVSYIGGAFFPGAHIISFEEAIKHIDFEVIFLVMSMMIVVGILEGTGIFQWMAFMAYRLSRGRPIILVIILVVITSVASALLDNVTTMLLMAPISLQIALALNLDPLALVIPELMASNVGGISTLIGTPTNILIGSYADIGFNDFLINLTPGVAIALVVLVLYVRWVYRAEYRKIAGGISPTLYAKLEDNAQIKDPAKLRKGLIVFAVMLVLFVAGDALHLNPAVTSLLGATAFLVWVDTDIERMLEHVDWTTLVFFMALFIAVGAIQEVGLVSFIADFLAGVTAGQPVMGLIILVWASAFISTAIANIPFTAAMLPVIGFLSVGLDPGHTKYLFYGLSVGSAMGGNGSLIGSSPNVVAAGILERAGYPITYAKFLRVGMPAMLLTVLTGILWLLFRFFVIPA